eukprot:GHUV01025101.1.p1 GENE.GHUV01025101.1~~GHUV01025101.1.p1  ORF type:complete len:309 (+),score=28.99 GHUV01025101.1:163-1089(+)
MLLTGTSTRSAVGGLSGGSTVNKLKPSSRHLTIVRQCNRPAPRTSWNIQCKARQNRVQVQASASGMGSACAPRFSQAQGPCAVSTLPVINVPLGPSPSDPASTLDLQLEVLAPQSKSSCPVVIFTPGFLLNSSLYRSYAARLASWGYTCVLWDLSDLLDDTLTIAYMKQAVDLCSRDPRLRQYCDCNQLLLMGHSRGAKLSCLVADQVPPRAGVDQDSLTTNTICSVMRWDSSSCVRATLSEAVVCAWSWSLLPLGIYPLVGRYKLRALVIMLRQLQQGARGFHHQYIYSKGGPGHPPRNASRACSMS